MSEQEQQDTEQLVYFGGEVKALGDGRVGGYLVRFTDETEPDIEGDFFTAKTDFGISDGAKTPVYLNHRMPLHTRDGKSIAYKDAIGEGTLSLDDAGVLIDAILYHRELYEIMLAKMGWTSGTAPHLVDREPVGKAFHVTKWPLGIDASTSPAPADPGNRVMPLKSWTEMTPDLEVEPQEALSESASAATTDGQITVNVTVEQRAEKSATTEVKTMSEEKEKTTQEEAPVVDVAAIIKQTAEDTLKAYRAELEEAAKKAPPINRGGYVTGVTDEADRALKGNPFKSFGEMAMSVKAEGVGESIDKRLLPLRSEDGFELPTSFVKATGLSEGAPAAGGFLVGTDERLAIISRDWAVGNLINRVSMFPVGPNANGMTFNFENETSRVDGSRRGGVRGYWAAEAGVKTASQPEFRQVSLRLKKLVALVYATDELMADATALGAYLQSIYPEELMFKAEDSIINGTGAGQPLGILASGATYSVPIEVGQTAATVVAENLVKMWTHRDVSYNDYVWLLNQEVEAQLMLLGLAVGVGGVPVYLPPGGFSAAPYGSIFGRPVLPVEYCAALGTVGDIMLVAPSAYYMIEKGGTESASSIHVKFVYDETVWRFVKRLDGTPSINTPLTPYKGTASSISPFVTLAERA